LRIELAGGDWNHGLLYTFMTFHSVGNGIIIPTDELIFFRGVETTNQIIYNVTECNRSDIYISLISKFQIHEGQFRHV